MHRAGRKNKRPLPMARAWCRVAGVGAGRWPGSVAAGGRRRHVGRLGRQVAEGDPALGQVVGGHLEGHLIARDDADVVLLELAAGVGDQVVAVFQGDAVAAVRQHFRDAAVHFDEFFLGHVRAP